MNVYNLENVQNSKKKGMHPISNHIKKILQQKKIYFNEIWVCFLVNLRETLGQTTFE
jgi:hypothetical protein